MTGRIDISGSSSTCPTCGRRLPPGAKFCGYDGTVLGAPAAEVGSSSGKHTQIDKANKLCPSCQAIYPPYAMFCTVDATSLIPIRVSTPQAEEPDDLPLTELIGHTIGGKYRLEEFIGEGGMAVVYKATHINIERPVVIKIMQGRLLSNEKSVKRFEQECKLTAKINHPNVVSVFDVGFINGNQPYLVMEYIKGEALRDRMDREGQISLSTVAAILIQLCRGLQEAHSVGIIHRDLKPENILLQERADRPDWVKIVDFGIAHLVASTQRYTKTGNVVGTAEYMAPEQLKDIPIDTRADIYALGVILFEMLTARVPFEAETTEAVLLKQLLDMPEPPSKYRADLPPDSLFDQIVFKGMQKSPDDRYQTMTEMRLDLERIYNQLMLRRGL